MEIPGSPSDKEGREETPEIPQPEKPVIEGNLKEPQPQEEKPAVGGSSDDESTPIDTTNPPAAKSFWQEVLNIIINFLRKLFSK